MYISVIYFCLLISAGSNSVSLMLRLANVCTPSVPATQIDKLHFHDVFADNYVCSYRKETARYAADAYRSA